MKTNDAGKEIIKSEELLKLKAYICPAGIWTIGYGHTEGVNKGDVITEHQADAILDVDLDIAERAVEKHAPGLNANQFSALVSFVFNLGESKFATSTLLKRVKAKLWRNAANELTKWVYARDPKTGDMRRLPGLERRRAREAKLFLTAVS